MIVENERDMPENFRYISNGDLVEHEHDANMRSTSSSKCTDA
jgi:hypothetical protein